MKMKIYTRIVFALALGCASMYAQTVAGNIEGSVVDPANAVVANAPVTLVSADTGATRTGKTDSNGTYRFLNIEPGVYNVIIKQSGFKTETQTGIVVAAEETHNAGKMILTLGSVNESVSVTAEVAQVQLESSEKSQTVDSAALDDLTLKGRDLFGYMKLVPGVIDTSSSRDVTGPNQIGGITINGNTSAKNFTVDGITDMDTGSNGTLHYEPNLDSIQEMKVLASNYQAEYGRNSGGTITVVTKNGTQQFHGTAAWNHRHEEFNANSWSNTHTIAHINGYAVQTPRVPYRYNVETYSIGGPAYIPKVANKDKKHLFFFFSQERTGQYVSGGSQTQFMPTAAERNGDFSADQGNSNGNPIALKLLDPANGNIQFTNNIIPSSRINPIGQALLNYFPLPNGFTPTISSQLYVDNFFEQAAATHPRLNSVLRVDTYITSKISGYFRWINDADMMVGIYSGVQFDSAAQAGRICNGTACPPIGNVLHPNPGHGYSETGTYTITPTLINEVVVAEDWNTWSYYSMDNYASSERSLEPGLPTLFPIPTAAQNNSTWYTNNGYLTTLPTFSFGGGTFPGGASESRNGTSGGEYSNFNPIWTYQDNLSKIVGHHAFKMGVYVEHNNKIQPTNKGYKGAFSFSANSSIAFLNTNSGYANALLGDVNSYSQANATTQFNTSYWNEEFYIQDNWKVNRRLTLDLGLRMYHQTPQIDISGSFVSYNPTYYNQAGLPRIYRPYCNPAIATGAANPNNGLKTCSNAANGLEAQDPLTGAVVGLGFIGDYVPNTGNPGQGMVNLGVTPSQSIDPLTSTNPDAYHQAFFAYGPRIGFAYDLFGDGKTAIRGGWGLFYNRLDGNQVYGMSGSTPLTYSESVNNETLAQIASQTQSAAPTINSVPVGVLSPSGWFCGSGPTGSAGKIVPCGNTPFDAVGNASLDIQHNIDKNTTVDVGYSLNYSYNQKSSQNLNYEQPGTTWPFNPADLNPTTPLATGSSIGIAGLENTIYPGLGNVTSSQFFTPFISNSYNGLTMNINRRASHGFAWGAVYTFSKAMGHGYQVILPPGWDSDKSYTNARQSTDRRQNLQVNYNYNIPGIGKKLGFKPLGYITDNWAFSGITAIQSGAPYNPSCGLTSGSASITGGYTGTPAIGVRCNVIGNPMANIGTNGNGQVYFNPAAYQMASINTTGPNNSLVGPPVFGNAGAGSNLSLPKYTNFDVTMTKNIPLGSEKRVLKIQAQAYNVFNHTEISGIGTGITFSPTTNIVSNAQSLGYVTGALPNRVLAFSARLQF